MKKPRRTFSRDYKLAAVKKVLEQGLSFAEVARDLGIRDTLIHNWRKAFESDGTLQSEVGQSPSVEAALERLREENHQLKMGHDIFRKGGVLLCKRKHLRLHFILEQQAQWPIAILCRAPQVTRAAFCKWLHRNDSMTKQKQKQIVTEIKRIHLLPRH